MKLSNIKIPARIAVACMLPLMAFTGFAAMLESCAVLSTVNKGLAG